MVLRDTRKLTELAMILEHVCLVEGARVLRLLARSAIRQGGSTVIVESITQAPAEWSIHVRMSRHP